MKGYAEAAQLKISDWIPGAVGQQILEAVDQALYNTAAGVSALVRGYASLDTSTDPGDEDPYDATNVTLPAAPGFLSGKGAGDFGVARLDATFATGTITITNASGSAQSFAPGSLTFTRDTPFLGQTYAPTYRNAPDVSIYTNPDGTATVANGNTIDIHIVAEEQGIGSNADAGTVSLVTVLATGATATNAAAILAASRESADPYRDRCRIARSLLSLQGPADAYRFIALGAMKDDDGNIFFFPPGSLTTAVGIDSLGTFQQFPNARGTTLGINRVYVRRDSSTGLVVAYFATASGDPGAQALTDLTALFDQVYWPDCTTRSFNRAVEVTVNLVGTIKAKSGAGVTTSSIDAAATAAASAAFPTYDIGGFDQTAGAGTLYKQELESMVNGSDSHIYLVTLGTPAGNTALAEGRVAKLGGPPTWTVVIT